MKISNSDIINPDRDVKKTKPEQYCTNDEENDHDEVDVPVKSLSAETKSNINLSEDFLIESQVSKYTEKLVAISTVKPPSILVKRSMNFEADLDLINKAQIKYEKAGKFFKLLPDTVDMYREIISFLTTNNLEYVTLESRSKPRWIEVTITGLPCDTKIEQIMEALTEKDFDVEKIVQMTGFRNKKPLPLFEVVLPSSDKNENIFKITNLLNRKISVVRIQRDESHRCTKGCDIKNTQLKCTAKCKDEVPKGKNCCDNGQVVSFPASKKCHKGSKKNSRKEKTFETSLPEAKAPHYQKKHQEAHRIVNNVAPSKTSGKKKNYQELNCIDNDVTPSKASRKKKHYQELNCIDSNVTSSKASRNKKNYQELNCIDNNETPSKAFRNQKNYQELSHMAQSKTSCNQKNCQDPPGINKNKNKFESTTEFQDIIYIMQEFRNIFGKMEDAKIFAQQLRNAPSSVEKFKLFTELFLD